MKLKLYAVAYRAHACFHLNNFWNILQYKSENLPQKKRGRFEFSHTTVKFHLPVFLVHEARPEDPKNYNGCFFLFSLKKGLYLQEKAGFSLQLSIWKCISQSYFKYSQ